MTDQPQKTGFRVESNRPDAGTAMHAPSETALDGFVEDWRDVPGFEGIYQVSSLGRVKSCPRRIERRNGRVYTQRGRVLKGSNSNGRTVLLHGEDGAQAPMRVSRLVYVVFIGPIPVGQWVLHRDGNELNSAAQNLVLGDNTAAERMKVERNGGTHPLASGQRIADAFWTSGACGERGYAVS